MRKSQKIAVVTATSVALVGGGVAYAFWTTSGSGSGSATSSAGVANLTVSQTGTPSNLGPDLGAKAISGTVTNNADNAAKVTQVVVTIASVAKAANAPAGICDATDYVIDSGTMTVNKELASGASTTFTGATIDFVNKATNQDACKGATVNLSYAAS